MPDTLKPGWVYIDCETLKQRIAYSLDTGWVFCEDKVRYSPAELSVLENSGVSADMATHRVKKIIGGELVKIERAQSEQPFEDGTV